jgi:colanic acid biosynthesis glycosyl transferase WcaI
MLTFLCEDLAKLNHQVTVLAAVPHFPSGRVSGEYRRGIWQWETQNGVRICRVRVPSGDRKNLRHRLIVFLIYQILASIAGLGVKYDRVIITNPAIETGLPFMLLSWLRRKPVIFCVWDLYPEVGIQLGIFRHKFIIGIVCALENWCLRHSAVVHALAENFVDHLRYRVNPATRILVLLPWIDTDFIKPLVRQNDFAIEYGLCERFVVMYAGNLGLSQGLEYILSAARKLADQKNVQFVFVGDGPNLDNLVAQVQEFRLENVRFIPFQSRERLPEVLATADVSLVSLQTEIGDVSIPSKTFPILASGRPLLAFAGESSSIWKLVKESKAGWCVPFGEVSALAESILSLERNPALCQQMGANARSYVIRHHSRHSAALVFHRILIQL